MEMRKEGLLRKEEKRRNRERRWWEAHPILSGLRDSTRPFRVRTVRPVHLQCVSISLSLADFPLFLVAGKAHAHPAHQFPHKAPAPAPSAPTPQSSVNIDSGVIVFLTSATGMLQTKKETTRILDVLQAKKVPFITVDCSTAENVAIKNTMQERSNSKVLPQVFKDGKFVGHCSDIDGMVEEETFDDTFGKH